MTELLVKNWLKNFEILGRISNYFNVVFPFRVPWISIRHVYVYKYLNDSHSLFQFALT